MKRFVMLGALAAPLVCACGSSSPSFAGIVNVTVHQAGKADVVVTPWMSDEVALDSPPGGAQGFFGTCTHAGSTWTADLRKAGSTAGTVHAIHLTVADGAATAATAVTIDAGTFSGSCSVASSTWTDTHDLRVAGECTGLTMPSDPRTADVHLTPVITNCTGD
jgi:hypothetical protein